MIRLSSPLPLRCRVPSGHTHPETGARLFFSRPWQEEDLFEAFLAGGWAAPNASFATREAAAFARQLDTLLHHLELRQLMGV